MKYLLIKLAYEDKEFLINKEFSELKELKQIKDKFKEENNLNGYPLFAIYKQITEAFKYE